MMKSLLSVVVALSVAASVAAGHPWDSRADSAPQQPARAANVLVVTMDGMRWQEVFGGMVADFLTKEAGGVAEAAPSQQRFGGSTPEQRREKLMPFLWTVVAKRGQIFGDPAEDSVARVTNGLRFSYPGYNELLSGAADPRIDSNDKIYNPNTTVLEWLNGQPAFKGKVAAFASWELLPWILNEPRSHVPSNGEGPPVTSPVNDRQRALNELAADLPPYWGATRFDAPTGVGALEYLKTHKPRVLYVMLGETDEWAHGRKYRPVSRRRMAQRSVHSPALGNGAEHARVRKSNGAGDLDRSRSRRSRRGLDQPRPGGSGRRADLDGRDGSQCARSRRSPWHESDAVTDRGDHRLAAWRGFQQSLTEGGAAAPAGAIETVAPVARGFSPASLTRS